MIWFSKGIKSALLSLIQEILASGIQKIAVVVPFISKEKVAANKRFQTPDESKLAYRTEDDEDDDNDNSITELNMGYFDSKQTIFWLIILYIKKLWNI